MRMENGSLSCDSQCEELEQLAKERLSEKRFHHTICVAKLAVELAVHYGENPVNARAAGLLHDITKEDVLSPDDIRELILLQTTDKSDIIACTVLENSKNLHHSITAYYYVKSELKVLQEDVLNAILFHTTGRAGMSMLEKIIYVADAVSYDRTYQEVLRLRKLSFEDIDRCILEIIDFTVRDLMSKKRLISSDTIDCYNDIITNKSDSQMA